MSELDRTRLDRVLPAVASAPDWADVLGRSRVHERRRRMVVLAIAALAAAVTTASALGVRAFVLEKSFIGLPPEGAIPSSPERGKLVLDYVGAGRPEGKNGKMKSWLYADGRRVWIQNAGYLEQRLTPEGVELLRSEALSTGHWTDEPPPPLVPNCGPGVPVGTDGCVPPMPPPAPDEPYTLPGWLNVVSPEAGRLTRVDRARDLDRLVKRLSDPGSWLPASAWARRQPRAYVPARFWVCYGTWRADAQSTPAEILSLLPPTAADILRGRPTTKNETLFGGPRVYRTVSDTCSDLATEDGRRLAAVLVAGGWEQEQGFGGSAYHLGPSAPDRQTVHVYFEPYLPHGEIGCQACW